MRLLRRTLLLGGTAAGLAGCSKPHPPSDIVSLTPGVSLRLPDPGELGRPIEVAQLVQATYQGHDIAFEGQLSVTPERILLAAIDPLGRQAMTVRWAERSVSARVADWFATAPRPENMLADIMLIYWPADPLRRGLSGATLEEEPGKQGPGKAGPRQRVIRDSQRPLIQIDYTGADPWNGATRYRNLVWDYTLRVRSAEVPS